MLDSLRLVTEAVEHMGPAVGGLLGCRQLRCRRGCSGATYPLAVGRAIQSTGAWRADGGSTARWSPGGEPQSAGAMAHRRAHTRGIALGRPRYLSPSPRMVQ